MPFIFNLLLNLLLCSILTGLIWTIQLVHYPGFALIGDAESKNYQQQHTRRIAWLVIPLMLAELCFSGLLVWQVWQQDNITQPLLYWLSTACVWLVWLITFFVFVPLHSELEAKGYTKPLTNMLVSWNWPRTLLWTLRMLLLAYLLWQWL